MVDINVVDIDFAVVKPGEIVFIRPNVTMDVNDYDMLSDQLSMIAKDAGIKIVLMPEYLEVARVTQGDEENAV